MRSCVYQSTEWSEWIEETFGGRIPEEGYSVVLPVIDGADCEVDCNGYRKIRRYRLYANGVAYNPLEILFQ